MSRRAGYPGGATRYVAAGYYVGYTSIEAVKVKVK